LTKLTELCRWSSNENTTIN